MDLDLEKETQGPHKSMTFTEHLIVFEEIVLSARVASGARFGTLLGSILGAFAPHMIAESCLGSRLGALKSRSRALFVGPGGFQEPSKTPPRGPKAAKTAPRALQQAPGSMLGGF